MAVVAMVAVETVEAVMVGVAGRGWTGPQKFNRHNPLIFFANHT